MTRPRLYATPLSHFARKVRVLLHELGVEHEMVWISSTLRTDAAAFADNPLMRVPAFVDDGQLIVESDHIARRIVRKWDPADRLGVWSDDALELNRLAIANGVMDNEVVLLLTKRGGFEDLDSVAYFRKLAQALDGGLAWLDEHVDPEDTRFTWADVALVCMWQHVVHYASAKGLERHRRIAARVARLEARPSLARTTPAASLAQAEADGWKPA